MTTPYVPLRPGQVWVPAEPNQRTARKIKAVDHDRIVFKFAWSFNAGGSCSWTAWREWVERTGATVRESGR